jgi:hypothetical protein
MQNQVVGTLFDVALGSERGAVEVRRGVSSIWESEPFWTPMSSVK